MTAENLEEQLSLQGSNDCMGTMEWESPEEEIVFTNKEGLAAVEGDTIQNSEESADSDSESKDSEA